MYTFFFVWPLQGMARSLSTKGIMVVVIITTRRLTDILPCRHSYYYCTTVTACIILRIIIVTLNSPALYNNYYCCCTRVGTSPHLGEQEELKPAPTGRSWSIFTRCMRLPQPSTFCAVPLSSPLGRLPAHPSSNLFPRPSYFLPCLWTIVLAFSCYCS